MLELLGMLLERLAVLAGPAAEGVPCQYSFTAADLSLCVRRAALRYSLIRLPTTWLRSIGAVMSMA